MNLHLPSFRSAYLALGALEMLAEIFRGQFPTMYMFIKPFLMIVLALYLYKATGLQQTLDKMIGIALAFSWIGDCILMAKGQGFFLTGLISFLLAHLMYILVFTKQFRFQGVFYLVSMCLLVYGGLLMQMILPNMTSQMYLPIILYAVVLLTMTAIASGRKDIVSKVSFVYTFGGAVLFMVSDSLLAINKFASPFAYANIPIMLLYILGQFGIVEGYVKSRIENFST